MKNLKTNGECFELTDEMLSEIVGGRPRIHLGRIRAVNPFSAIKNAIKSIRDAVNKTKEPVIPLPTNPDKHPYDFHDTAPA